ncbi:MAG: FMN-dependent NADH-azoreductase [Pseudomonadales bacterium]
MSDLLVIKSSILGEDSSSNRLLDEFVDQWRGQHPQHAIVEQDFSEQEIPHLSKQSFYAFAVPEQKRSAAQMEATRLSDELTAQFLQADNIVVGMPMYNLGIPSCFKAYIDHISRAGQTFKYTEKGPVGLAGNKTAYVLGARGGYYLDTPNDTQTPYIDTIFRFFGIETINYVIAEGLNISPKHKAESMDKALADVRALFT